MNGGHGDSAFLLRRSAPSEALARNVNEYKFVTGIRHRNSRNSARWDCGGESQQWLNYPTKPHAGIFAEGGE